MTLPVLHLSGPPYEQGLRHGRELGDRIAHNLDVYFERFAREAKLPRAEALARAARYREALAAGHPAYFAALRGVADGAGRDLDELVALNVRYELMYYQFGVNALRGAGLAGGAPPHPDGCTSFAVLPEASADGHLLLGENWDWIPQVRGAVLHTVEPDGLATLAFTEAGIVGGKIGLNSAGLGLAINGLTATGDDWARPSAPFHVRCYDILRARDFEVAVRVVTGTARACSANFVIAAAASRFAAGDRAVDIEAAPDETRLLGPEGGCLAHTNHFLDPAALGVVEPPNEKYPHSYHRLTRMRALLGEGEDRDVGGRLSVADLQAALRDHDGHPYSICRHIDPGEPPEEHYTTVTSAVMDLHARTLWLSDGPPCENAYRRYSLEEEDR